jgi:hypothetical protein
MRVANAAKAFDNMPCYDAYSGLPLFYGQMGLYDDNKRDSETSERRVISTAPSVTLPARRVVLAAGQHYILGTGYPDDFKGHTVRVSYVAHDAPHLATVRTLAELCLGQAGLSAYAGRVWFKNAAFTEQSSVLAPQHHIYFAQTEVVPDDAIITLETRILLVRMSTVGPAGTLVVQAEQLPLPVMESGTFVTGAYDPVTETYGIGNTAAPVVRMRWQALFQYRSKLAPTFGPEDVQLAVAKSLVTAKAGMRVTLSDGAWRLADVSDEGLVWLCRAVRHA